MKNDLQAAIDRLQESYKRMTIFGYLDDDDARYMDALATALTALRDAQARQEGCWHCRGIEAHEIKYAIGFRDKENRYRHAPVDIPYRFCGSCGRPLEPVGNADTLPTTEQSSGVEEPTVSKTERDDQKGPEPGGEGEG